MSIFSPSDELSPNNMHLIEEAIRRLERMPGNTIVDRETLALALAAEIHHGRRDLFSLVRAGQRVLDGL